MKMLHISCLETWLGSSNTTKCEICQFQFNVPKKRHPIKWTQEAMDSNTAALETKWEEEIKGFEEEKLEISDREPKAKRLARSERKRKHYEELLQRKRETRKQKKLERKQRLRQDSADTQSQDGIRKGKREVKAEIRKRLEEARRNGQRICIDCSLEEHMNEKEIGKLAMQIGRLYGSNRKADNPVHLYLIGLRREGTLYQDCVKKNDGFLNYMIDIQDKGLTELFPMDKVVYLSPDAEKTLSDLDPDTVYVIGGLVDESISKNISRSSAESLGIQTARLPIQEHMEKCDQASYSTVLSVNQVFDILLTYLSTRSWRAALAAGVPRRKGYILKSQTDT